MYLCARPFAIFRSMAAYPALSGQTLNLDASAL